MVKCLIPGSSQKPSSHSCKQHVGRIVLPGISTHIAVIRLEQFDFPGNGTLRVCKWIIRVWTSGKVRRVKELGKALS